MLSSRLGRATDEPNAAKPHASGEAVGSGERARVDTSKAFIVQPQVSLRALSRETIPMIVETARLDALPNEVMPSTAESWTPRELKAYAEFLSHRLGGFDGPERELSWAVLCGEQCAGVLRLQRRMDEAHEAGLWIGRSWRGLSIGRATLQLLRQEGAALGIKRFVAQTTTSNAAALAVLRHHQARLVDDAEGNVQAEFS
jgi:[ribosomal protein S5]-alanine N-acetyltransferase